MCGFVAVQNGSSDPKTLYDSIQDLSHRGPDDDSLVFNEEAQVGLAHCRLSIIDVAGGDQPMKRGKCTLVYNGEIYNYRELREELKSQGRTFKTDSDTEVLLQSYREWGVDCLKKLRGMFSFAIWDAQKDRIFLARDRFGQKPLFYSHKNGKFYASSEIQSLLHFKDISRKMDVNSLPFYLGLQYIPSPRSGFRDIKKLQPGQYMVVEEGSIKTRKHYWDLNYMPKSKMDFPEAQKKVKKLLKESVKLRMRSDVPIGAFLSGGIDSSIVVALMSQFTDKPVRTFSVAFDHDEFNELPYARKIAEKYNTDHHEFEVTAEVEDLLPELVRHYGEPFADSSNISVYYVSRETAREVKVALTGDGGDELFAGYSLYQYFKPRDFANNWIPGFVKKAVAGLSESISNAGNDRGIFDKALLFSEYLPEDPGAWYYFLASYFNMSQLEAVLADEDILASNSPLEFCKNEFQRFTQVDTEAEKAMAYDARNYLPEDLLYKVDIASMMNSLECRSPLIDHKLAEFVARLPMNHKLGYGSTSKKKLLKSAFEEELPQEILNHRKTGFGIPRSDWLKGDLEEYMREILLSPSDVLKTLLNVDIVEKIIRKHTNEEANYGSQLWAILMLELWIREFNVKL